MDELEPIHLFIKSYPHLSTWQPIFLLILRPGHTLIKYKDTKQNVVI